MAKREMIEGVGDFNADSSDLLSDLDGSVYRDVCGYDAKYFPRLLRVRLPDESCQETSPPPLRSSEELAVWLNTLGNQQYGIPRREFIPDHHLYDKPDGTSLYLVESGTLKARYRPSAADVLVLGLLFTDEDLRSDDEAVPALYALASTIFAAHSDRLFLHGFLIRKSTMETWTFDRAGMYAGKAFRVMQEPGRFQSIIASYMSMNCTELGLNPFVERDRQGAFLELGSRDRLSLNTRLSLEEDAFVRQDGLIGAGTTCFKARASCSPIANFVVKFTWTQDNNHVERTLLALAARRGVCGLIRLETFHDMTDIAFLRQGLVFGTPFKLLLSQKPKDLDQSSHIISTESENEAKFDNFSYKCMITSPLGRPLDTFSSPSELFAILRDAVRALSSLYFEANIIHRDISTQNIIIVPNADNPHTPAGMLIDLDRALDLSQPQGERLLIGSEGFMAIGILGGDDHTYRHDLESILYVFLWIAVCHDGSGDSAQAPPRSRLQSWCGLDFLASFHAKMKDMEPDEFQLWTSEEFTDPFKPFLPLASALHELLFPIRRGKFFIGTDFDDTSSRALYQGMATAFDKYANQ